MANRLLLISIFFLSCRSASAQSDIQVMLKQIALIALHVKELENAIEIARDGLTTIHEIKNGEFHLHNLFFSSLNAVNPAIAKYSKIGVIISDQLSIVSAFKKLIKRLQDVNRITTSEMSYIESVYTNITAECAKTLNDLISVTTSGNLEMTDDERIKRIDELYENMNDKYAFSLDFTSRADKLASERDHATSELRLQKSLE